MKIEPPDGGVKATSYAKIEDVRSVSKVRLTKRFGSVSPATLARVADRLRIVFDL